jgi:hypothetical protein
MECVVDGCNEPTPDELGDYVGRQMAAIHVGAGGDPVPACGLLGLEALAVPAAAAFLRRRFTRG